jgi:hypothetical protein
LQSTTPDEVVMFLLEENAFLKFYVQELSSLIIAKW